MRRLLVTTLAFVALACTPPAGYLGEWMSDSPAPGLSGFILYPDGTAALWDGPTLLDSQTGGKPVLYTIDYDSTPNTLTFTIETLSMHSIVRLITPNKMHWRLGEKGPPESFLDFDEKDSLILERQD